MKPDPKQNALIEQRRQIDKLKKANDALASQLAEAAALLDDAITHPGDPYVTERARAFVEKYK